MEAVLIALLVVAGIVGLFFLVKFIKFLFSHDLISKILSIVNAAISMLISIPIFLFVLPDTGDDLAYKIFIICVPTFFATLAWLFFMGEEIFDVTWDEQTYDVEAVNDSTVRVSPHWVGGFFSNFLGAFAIIGVAYFFLSFWQPIFFIPPLLVVILDIASLVKRKRRRRG